MLKIKITTNFSYWPLERQTPNWSGKWGNCEFYINKPIPKCDYWVVVGGLSNRESTKCQVDNTIFITTEPPIIKKYNNKFLQQFNKIVSCDRDINHSNIVFCQQALPWMVGGKYKKETKNWSKNFKKDYDELIKINNYKKNKLISIILSKKKTKNHKKRLKFIFKLQKYFGKDLDVFGVDINEIEDKWDGIAPYKYYLAIENSSVLDYWTEKISDSFLAGAYPFYSGCPNIQKYFPKGSFTLIDINNVKKSIKTIEENINKSKYENSLGKIRESKNLILNKYNFFPMICEHIETNFLLKYTDIILEPEQMFL